MIINDQEKLQYVVFRPDAETIPVVFTVNGDTLTIDYDIESNNDYIVVIKDVADTTGEKMGDPIVYQFSSTYSPLYTTLRQIQTDLGSIYSIMDPDRVLSIIRANSIEVASLTSFALTSNEVKQYIRYQSEYDALMAYYSDISSQNVNRFSLGDFAVTTSNSDAIAIDSVLAELRTKIKNWLAKLSGSTGAKKQATFVRGGSEYPSYMSRDITSS